MRKLILLMVATTLSACATVKQISVTQPIPADIEKTGVATAGAISVDVTPPPGMPMGGYSVMANSGKGFRTRLKARVVYLNDGQGHSTALVQTDLTAGSLLVQHKVVEAVAAKTGLKASDIVITASHSHSAPVNHFENDFYNKHMSSGQGLEEEFLNFASQRIADGILKAYEDRRPALVATGRKDIYGYNRNRALDAYILNENISEFSLEDAVEVAEQDSLAVGQCAHLLAEFPVHVFVETSDLLKFFLLCPKVPFIIERSTSHQNDINISGL